MNITITIENPSSNVLNALAQAREADLVETKLRIDEVLDSIERSNAIENAVPDTPQQSTQPDPHDTALRIASVADIDNYLDIGTEVHWHGQKYVFDGVVEKIDDNVLDAFRDDEGEPDDKVLFVRRNDTDKLVSLTLRDLQVGRLTLID